MEEETAVTADRVPNHIFILSGQSNMCGRGGVSNKKWNHVVPRESMPNPSILRFTAKSKWIEAQEPIHADIDVAKTCGIGPGMPFASSLLSSLGDDLVIGLVPCAIGGTPIAEWGKGTKHYNDMIERANGSVRTGGGGEIKGVLWYQGESDTDVKSKADVYKIKMENLIGDVRSDLGLPSLPFIHVALASGMTESLIREVREAQLGIDLPNVICVDAKGLPLNSDHLHLTTDAQVQLGKMLAQAYVANFCTSGGIPTFSCSRDSLVPKDQPKSAIPPTFQPSNGNDFTQKRIGMSSACVGHNTDGSSGYLGSRDLEIGGDDKDLIFNLLQPNSKLNFQLDELHSAHFSKTNITRHSQINWTFTCAKTYIVLVLVLVLNYILCFQHTSKEIIEWLQHRKCCTNLHLHEKEAVEQNQGHGRWLLAEPKWQPDGPDVVLPPRSSLFNTALKGLASTILCELSSKKKQRTQSTITN